MNNKILFADLDRTLLCDDKSSVDTILFWQPDDR